MLDLAQVSSERVEPDLMDYLMAPSGVQSMAPENWEEVWQTVVRETEWPIAVCSSEGGTTFECVVCRHAGRAETTMTVSHLCHSDCRKALSETVDPKSLLGVILQVACESPPKVHVLCK